MMMTTEARTSDGVALPRKEIEICPHCFGATDFLVLDGDPDSPLAWVCEECFVSRFRRPDVSPPKFPKFEEFKLSQKPPEATPEQVEKVSRLAERLGELDEEEILRIMDIIFDKEEVKSSVGGKSKAAGGQGRADRPLSESGCSSRPASRDRREALLPKTKPEKARK